MNPIAILGDFNLHFSTHRALNESVRQIKTHLDADIQFEWIATDAFNYKKAFEERYCGLWIAPGSPYADMQNVIDAIAYVRENNIPAFGNCGGFQHMVIEFARNICGIAHADHEETNPDALEPVISKLSCSLVEQEEMLTIAADSKLFQIIQAIETPGRYYCSYGINEKYVVQLQAHGLAPTALSPDGQVRAVELKTHPFFIGTLFQPALTSTPKQPNPVIVEFVKTCVRNAKGMLWI